MFLNLFHQCKQIETMSIIYSHKQVCNFIFCSKPLSDTFHCCGNKVVYIFNISFVVTSTNQYNLIIFKNVIAVEAGMLIRYVYTFCFNRKQILISNKDINFYIKRRCKQLVDITHKVLQLFVLRKLWHDDYCFDLHGFRYISTIRSPTKTSHLSILQ